MLTTDTSPSPATVSPTVPASPVRTKLSFQHRPLLFAAFSFVLILCFIRPLYDLVRFAIHSDLYSHILLIPFISIYLAWVRLRYGSSRPLHDSKDEQHRLFGLAGTISTPSPDQCPKNETTWKSFLPSRWQTLVSGLSVLAGFTCIIVYFWTPLSGRNLPTQDHLALTTFSFVCFLVGGYAILLSKQTLRALLFPLAFLLFMIPFPTFLEHALASLLQRGSADAAYAFLKLSGMPVFRQGFDFQLPGFSMHVAPECSGIHSSVALFIASLLAGNILLAGTWPRAIVALAVVPLGILRNGFRIFVLGQLCVRVDPNWINSDLHHRGGPIFFVLSLVPFFLLLLWLRKKEVQKLKLRTVG